MVDQVCFTTKQFADEPYSLENYLKTGGYQVWQKILEEKTDPVEIMGESTPDGQFFLKVEEECLAACCGAPMMQLNHVYHENLTTDKIDALLESVKTNGSLHKKETS